LDEGRSGGSRVDLRSRLFLLVPLARRVDSMDSTVRSLLSLHHANVGNLSDASVGLCN
jgi:hypothetical protein